MVTDRFGRIVASRTRALRNREGTTRRSQDRRSAGVGRLAEPLEPRLLLAAPRVDAVLVDSSAWTVPFRNYLTAQGLGSGGYAIPAGTGQFTPLPWVNVDRIKVHFNQAVTVSQGDMYLRGSTGGYASNGFSYDSGTNTATWTFASPLPVDHYAVYLQDTVVNGTGERLDGEWRDDGTAVFPSGDGTASGIFRFRFNVTPGDADRSGKTEAADYSLVNAHAGTTTTSPGSPPHEYSPFIDVDGNAAITSGLTSTTDAKLVHDRFFQALPAVSMPHVAEVLVDSSSWTADFRSYLAANGLGSGGFSIPAGAGQTDELPWVNVNRIKLRFDQDVSVSKTDLTVRGVTTPTYTFSDYAFDPATSIATWTLAAPVGADRLSLTLFDAVFSLDHNRPDGRGQLDGDWVNARSTFPSGDELPGGGFGFRMNVLPGDVDRDGDVDINDKNAVSARSFTSPSSPGTPPNTYTANHDVDGSAVILANDTSAVNSRIGTSLPAADPPPRVAAVLVDSSDWTTDFRNYLTSQGLGSGGYSIPSGAAQLTDVPWTNLNRVKVRFSEDVFVQAGDLRLFGVNVAEYLPSDFSYDAATFTATWTYPDPIGPDKLLLDLEADGRGAVTDKSGDGLDGEFASGKSAFPSGNGVSGTDFKFRVNVLPGDVDRDGDVDLTDKNAVVARWFTTPSSPGTPPNTYSAYYDVDGSASILANDSSTVNSRIGTSLPAAEPAPPRVTAVMVDSSSWAADFRSYLAAQGLGSDGFLVGGGSAQLGDLPWTNIDRIKVRFSEPVTVVQGDLLLNGVNVPSYTVGGFSYDSGTNTATWTLSAPVANDKLLVHLKNTIRDQQNDELDGEWVNGADAYPSGDGNAGGLFQFRLNVLPGDVDRDGDVDINDKNAVSARSFTSPSNPGTPPNTYTAYHDVNGSAVILADDTSAVNGRMGTALPAGEPTPPSLPPAPGGMTANVVEDMTYYVNRMDAQWQDVAGETGYRIERSVNGASGWEVIGEVGAGTTSFSKYDVGRTYSYRVRALNAAGASVPVQAVRPVFNSEIMDLKVTAHVAASPAPRITLTWPQRTDMQTFQVSRRARDAWNSQPFSAVSGLLPAGAFSFTDTTAQAGVEYEYEVRGTPVDVATYGAGAANYVESGIAVDAPGAPARYDDRGKVILLVEESLLTTGAGLPSLLPQVQQTIQDLVGDGWTVVGRDGAAWSTSNGTVPRNVPEQVDDNLYKARVAAVKGYIQNVYNADPTHVKSVFLLGNVPIPYSGLNAPDGHPEHKGAWPADVYYGDVAPAPGQDPNQVRWHDSGNLTTASRRENWNQPGDGKFDEDTLTATSTGIGGREPELMVGRVDLSNLPAFTQTGESADQTERRLLVRYLTKDHAFRQKQFDVARRALIDDDLSQYSEGFGWIAFRNAASTVGPSAIDVTEYFPTLQDPSSQGYLFASGFSFGWYDSNTQYWIPHGDPAVGVITWDTADFAAAPTKGVFNTLFGSWLGDWDMTNSMLRGALAADGYGLTSSWGTIQDEFYHHMGLGEPVAFGMRASLNSQDFGYRRYGYNALTVFGDGPQTHETLQGDPTLRMHVVAPPSGVTETAVSGGVQISWTASPEAKVSGYDVYVSSSATGPFTKIASGVGGTSYTHSGGSTASVYMVRAIKLETVPSGSYYNASQGAFSDGIGSMLLAAPGGTAATRTAPRVRPPKPGGRFSERPITRSAFLPADAQPDESVLGDRKQLRKELLA
jgi:hypothetical protein